MLYYSLINFTMRKCTLFGIMLFFGITAFSQAVKDRNVIPIAVNLNQVLRLNVTNGGNIEFVFNSIDDYKNGLGSGDEAQYQTDFSVASSTDWSLEYGAETATLIGTDDPSNTLALDNVGLKLTVTGAVYDWTTEYLSTPTTDGADVADLDVSGTTLITVGSAFNAGDAVDNSFTINWRCGTLEDDMNSTALLDQSLAPDRYVVNVLFDLTSIIP
jgi:hypothetical protein